MDNVTNTNPYFQFHPLSEVQEERQFAILDAVSVLHDALTANAPQSRELSTAIQYLRTTQFWALEAILLEGIDVGR